MDSLGPQQTVRISVVVPALNEEENLRVVYERVKAVFAGLDAYDFELIVTDNHSDDETYDVAKALASEDERVRVFRFSKNFGYQRSIYAAYLLCSGAAAVQLDADLQDPPELIPRMLQLWREEGAMVVYGIRTRRAGESGFTTMLRKMFYRLVDALSEDDLPRDAGDFRLLDRRLIELLRHQFDTTPYIRGAIAASGFRQVGIEYERDERTRGKTKFRLRDLVRLATDGILNHSLKPLHLASVIALVVAGVALIGVFGYSVGRLAFGKEWPAGFATLALIQLVGIFLNAMFLGIIGAYVGRMFIQLKSGPLVVIESSEPGGRTGTALLAQMPIYRQDLTHDSSPKERTSNEQ